MPVRGRYPWAERHVTGQLACALAATQSPRPSTSAQLVTATSLHRRLHTASSALGQPAGLVPVYALQTVRVSSSSY